MLDEEESHTVFAYGSNLDPQRVRERCPGATHRRPGVLQDHRLVFNKIALERDGSGYANVEPAVGEVVEGALFDLSRNDLLRLDRYEGHPGHYSRRLMAVHEADGERVVAWVYFATPEFKSPGLVARPDYLQHLLAGRDVLSEAYAARIEELLRRDL